VRTTQLVRGGMLLALTCGLPAGPAEPGTATTTFQVTANINVNCAIQATSLNFGDYALATLNAQSEIVLICTNAAQWNIGLDQGTFPGATVTTRQMTGPGTSSLAYSLFSDPARTVNWGNTIGTDTVAGVGNGHVEVIPVYGQIPSGQNTAAGGGYVDTITATVTF
jgi:spore coat protein U-like protein